VDELGSLLREAREAKGLTLAEVQEVIRVNPKYLEALEDGAYHLLPTPVHVRGYLRNYARFLQLDPVPLLQRYELNRSSQPTLVAVQPTDDRDWDGGLQSPADPVFFDPVNVNLGGGSRSDSGTLARLFIIVSLLVTIALVATFFIPKLTGRDENGDSLADDIQNAVSDIVNGTEETATSAAGNELIPGATELITSTARNIAIQLPTATATRPSLPATMETIRLSLEITERTWLKVTIDGEDVYQGLARRDEGPFEWEAQQEATLRTGNAIGIFVTINEVQLGRLGGRGEVVEQTWTTTSSG
jgi:cytoskeletal protein RodZ